MVRVRVDKRLQIPAPVGREPRDRVPAPGDQLATVPPGCPHRRGTGSSSPRSPPAHRPPPPRSPGLRRLRRRPRRDQQRGQVSRQHRGRGIVEYQRGGQPPPGTGASRFRSSTAVSESKPRSLKPARAGPLRGRVAQHRRRLGLHHLGQQPVLLGAVEPGQPGRQPGPPPRRGGRPGTAGGRAGPDTSLCSTAGRLPGAAAARSAAASNRAATNTAGSWPPAASSNPRPSRATALSSPARPGAPAHFGQARGQPGGIRPQPPRQRRRGQPPARRNCASASKNALAAA